MVVTGVLTVLDVEEIVVRVSRSSPLVVVVTRAIFVCPDGA